MTKMNGHDDPKITQFPEKKERAALEKARLVHHSHDASENEPALNLPPTVKVLCLLNIGFFLIVAFLPLLSTTDIYQLSFVPARYFGAEPFGIAGVISPFTHMFIHAGWLHLGINIGMLMAFGAGLEKKIGGRRMLLLYFASGFCGALTHALAYHATTVPMVGASGAISGLFGGILMLMYEEGMMGVGYRKLLPLVAVWIGISVIFGFFGAPGIDNPIAWTTHIGGFIGGLLLYKTISRMKAQH